MGAQENFCFPTRLPLLTTDLNSGCHQKQRGPCGLVCKAQGWLWSCKEQDLGDRAEPSPSREAADASKASCAGQMRDTGLPKLQKSNSSLFVDDRARSVTGC